MKDGKAPAVDPWEKAYMYGRRFRSAKVAHIMLWHSGVLCDSSAYYSPPNHTPDPYPVCRNCLKTKRAKELGL